MYADLEIKAVFRVVVYDTKSESKHYGPMRSTYPEAEADVPVLLEEALKRQDATVYAEIHKIWAPIATLMPDC